MKQGGISMAYASKDLINEHSWLIKGAEILERMTEILERGATVDTEDLIEIVLFFQLFADKCHYHKEEDYYFEVLRSHSSEHRGLLEHLNDEHRLGRIQLKHMERAVMNEKLDIEEFIKSAYGYIGILRSHIEAEQYELYPLGDKVIPREKQDKLLQLFGRIDQEVLGAGAYERLYDLFQRLENTYSRKKTPSERKEVEKDIRIGEGYIAKASKS